MMIGVQSPPNVSKTCPARVRLTHWFTFVVTTSHAMLLALCRNAPKCAVNMPSMPPEGTGQSRPIAGWWRE
eukprot:15903809-Heterocapsa_arctica.AAC.1